MSGTLNKDEIVWERLNKAKKWLPYSAVVCDFIENAYENKLTSICLGDVDPKLKVFDVDVKEFRQTSQATGTKCPVRRRVIHKALKTSSQAAWEWCGDAKKSWHSYSPDITSVLENSYSAGESTIDLNSRFPGYNYTVDLTKMMQINNFTRYHRPIRRIDDSGMEFPPSSSGFSGADSNKCAAAYSNGLENGVSEEPAAAKPTKNKKGRPLSKKVSQLWKKMNIGKTDDSEDDDDDEACNESLNKKLCSPDTASLASTSLGEKGTTVPFGISSSFAAGENGQSSGSIVYALVNGKPWKDSWPPYTPDAKLKPVPGIDPLYTESGSIKKHKKKKSESKKPNPEPVDDLNVFVQFTEETDATSEEEQCLICYDALRNGSPYDGDSTLLRLKLCAHIFHKSCLNAMYECGNKDNHLRCPKCKTIHGVKCGNQPPGTMTFYVLPYSLPGYPDRDTIQITYHIKQGIQGSEHPNPGRRYTARGFPRCCYLPDNEMGRNVLRLLIKAWERRLIFTVGTSSTTGENDTVTWNEIHHKTEFGFNRHGHGYPDPSYFENVLAELAAHGVVDAAPPRIPTDQTIS